MLIYADMTRRAVSFADQAEWVASPMAGVERRMLERDGDEVARATGEEFLVLEGALPDELGDYPAGTYVRDPPGSTHAPWSETGCVLFVKLRQFHPEDLELVVVDCRSAEWFPGTVKVSASCRCTSLEASWSRWCALRPASVSCRILIPAEEIYVLEGAVEDEQGRYTANA